MTARSLEDIQDEILDQLHAGEPIDREAFVARYPEHADALQRFFGLISVIETPAEGKPSQPSRLGEFEIIREIGRGGMGVVYEARQVSLNRRVALKVLPPAMRSDRRLLARFQREAEAAARLRHPNIVPVYSIGESAGAPFFAMELVDGRSLADVIKARKAGGDAGLPPAGPEYRRWAVATAARIADALDYAHGRSILHRDIKPGNILLEADGTPRLTDFGLALDLQASELTQTGEMFGSPLYMSPEQAFRRSAPVDARTDIYSLAVTLYELLLLRLPYHGTTHAELMSALSSGVIVAPREADPGLPEPLERVLVQALRSEPHDRYATAASFAADLRASLERPEEVRAVTATAKPAPTDGEEADFRGVYLNLGSERWWGMVGFFLIVAGLSLLLRDGPVSGWTYVFVGSGLALWVVDVVTHRRWLAAKAAARGEPAQPGLYDRVSAWRRKDPVLGTAVIGCGCLGLIIVFALAPCALLLAGRRALTGPEVSVIESSSGRTISVGDVTIVQPAETLESLRRVAVPFDLSIDAVMPNQPVAPPDLGRLDDYPESAWPPLLGSERSLAPASRELEWIDGFDAPSVNDEQVAIEGPLDGRYVSRTSQLLLCPAGIGDGGGVTAQQYLVLLVDGDLHGRCVFESYATLVVDGDLTGGVEARSYVGAVVTGDLVGRFVAKSYAIVYIEGQLEGTLAFEAGGKVYIRGRTRQSSLGKIEGRAEVLLMESDMAPGQHTIGELEITVAP